MTLNNAMDAARVMIEDTDIARQAFCFNITLSVVCFVGFVIVFIIFINCLKKCSDINYDTYEAIFKTILFMVVVAVFGILTIYYCVTSYLWVTYPEIECAHYLQFIAMFG